MPKNVKVKLADLEALIEYCYNDEAEHCEEVEETEGCKCEGHIFYVIERLSNAVDKAKKEIVAAGSNPDDCVLTISISCTRRGL